MNKRIYTVDAICGAGKTHGTCNYAVEEAYTNDTHICIIQPSKDLINETFTNLEAIMKATGKCIPVTKIFSGQDETSVSSRLSEHLISAGSLPSGQILLITHEAFFGLPYWHGSNEWEIIIDEIPNITPRHPLNLEKDSDRLKEIASVTADTEGLEYYLVEVKDQKLADDCVHLKNDVLAVFRDLCKDLLKTEIDVFCLRGQWDKVSANKNNLIEFFSVIKPEIVDGFKKVTIMGAHFTDSLLYMVWSNMGVEFKANTHIKLRHSIHDIKQRRLDVWYLSESNWSKSLRDKIGCAEGRIDPLIPSLITMMGNDEFAWCANNDIETKAVDPFFNGRATRISNISHGINIHQGKHKIIALSALNTTPAHFKILERKYGIDPIELKKAGSHQTLYQAIMRCSLRDPAATAPVTVVLPDKALGEWFVSQFKPNGNIRLKRVPHGIGALEWVPSVGSAINGAGRPPINEVAMSAVERKRALLDKKSGLLDQLASLFWAMNYKKIRNEIPIIRYSVPEIECNEINELQVSFVKDIKDKNPIVESMKSNEDLISLLKEMAGYSWDHKSDGFLISPAKFANKAGIDTSIGLDNIVSLNGLWLDQDGGSLTPEEMHTLFPGLRLVAMNSWSGNTRYFIPTTTPMTKDVYHAIWDAVVSAIEAYGYSSDKKKDNFHGLDKSKRCANSKFYVPCQAKDKSKSFFIDYPGAYLDVLEWVECNTLADETTYTARQGHANPQSAAFTKLKGKIIEADSQGMDEALRDRKAQAAIAKFRSAPSGEGNKAFYKLGCALKGLGFDRYAAHNMLSIEAQSAHSPSERKAQISTIIKKLF